MAKKVTPRGLWMVKVEKTSEGNLVTATYGDGRSVRRVQKHVKGKPDKDTEWLPQNPFEE